MKAFHIQLVDSRRVKGYPKQEQWNHGRAYIILLSIGKHMAVSDYV